MPVLRTLLALSVAGSPPALVPDARGAVALWCPAACPEAEVEALKAALDEDFVLRPWLPRRAASSARASVQVVAAAAYTYGLPNAEGRDASRLSEAELTTLAASPELLLIRTAVPLRADPMRRAGRVARAALDFARATGAVLEDADSLQLYGPEAWQAARVEALDPKDPAMWELFSLGWSEDGARVVTRGLREHGLHEWVVEGVDERVAEDVAVTLVLLAQAEHERGTPPRNLSVEVDALSGARTRAWLQGWRVYGDDPGAASVGSGTLHLEVRNQLPAPGDPEGPLLQVGPPGALDDPDAWARLMDAAWGWAGPGELAIPAPGWSGE